MRLLRVDDHGELSAPRYISGDAPPYAILSHTWGEQEVTLNDLTNGSSKTMTGYTKIQLCLEQAKKDGLQYVWVDTCCIDKSSSAELQEAINSMFRWYQHASICYVYLEDVLGRNRLHNSAELYWESTLRQSRWFTRSWTLQELIAPPVVEFFSRDFEPLGDRRSLEAIIHEITAIPIQVLRGTSVFEYSTEERLSWAAKRQSTRTEDGAYSLLGIFNTFMPLIYGEGQSNAFARLRRKISKSSRYESGEAENVYVTDSQFERVQPGEQISTAQSLTYFPLTGFSFRIFVLEAGGYGDNIRGHLKRCSLVAPPEYYALSYVWGQEPPIHQVTVNGQMMKLKPNLYHALLRIRPRTNPISIWVDSICIDQSNVLERNEQVKQMATIYRRASSVLVWLGEEDSTSKVALQFVSQITSSKFRWNDSWWHHHGFTALLQLLERSWFRRVWVLQEAAFSTNSMIRCGDREAHMDHFTLAIDLIRAELSTIQPFPTRLANTVPVTALADFHNSPAVRLLQTIEDAFIKSTKGDVTDRKMSLETLVDLSTYSVTTDQRDAIYALLNLASDIFSLSQSGEGGFITPDYGKDVLDVFVDFVWHCCRYSGSIDIVCRPWAPISSDMPHSLGHDRRLGHISCSCPSWIASRDNLPFGNPSLRQDQRVHGSPLVGGSQKRRYNAHFGYKPYVSIGRDEDGKCNGSLHAKGIIIGEIAERSPRMANAIITKECLRILGTTYLRPHSGLIDLQDTIWRTLCADRDEKGEPAPRFYRIAMLHLLQISSVGRDSGNPTDLFDRISSIDTEELLVTEAPNFVKTFLTVIRDVIWNRRTFRSMVDDNYETPLVGLAPQHATVGDQICILYGCSVPVVLRKLAVSDDKACWRLIGDAYVHGIMDGEAIRDVFSDTLKAKEQDFEIR